MSSVVPPGAYFLRNGQAYVDVDVYPNQEQANYVLALSEQTPTAPIQFHADGTWTTTFRSFAGDQTGSVVYETSAAARAGSRPALWVVTPRFPATVPTTTATFAFERSGSFYYIRETTSNRYVDVSPASTKTLVVLAAVGQKPTPVWVLEGGSSPGPGPSPSPGPGPTPTPTPTIAPGPFPTPSPTIAPPPTAPPSPAKTKWGLIIGLIVLGLVILGAVIFLLTAHRKRTHLGAAAHNEGVELAPIAHNTPPAHTDGFGFRDDEWQPQFDSRR